MHPYADPRLPSVRRSAGLLLLVLLGAALLGLILARTGPVGLAPLALPLALLVGTHGALRGIPWRECVPWRSVSGRLLGPFVLALLGVTLVTLGSADAVARWLPPPEWQRQVWTTTVGSGPVSLLALGIVYPVAEELWFRGTVLRGALARHPPPRALLFSALLFGAAHLDPYRVVSHSLIGWVFGRWAMSTGSLRLPVLGHLVLNLGIQITYHGSRPDPASFAVGGWTAEAALWDSCFVLFGAALVVVGVRGSDRLAGPVQPPVPAR
jgi:membrane protease YdiL (CAAX protease family)